MSSTKYISKDSEQPKKHWLVKQQKRPLGWITRNTVAKVGSLIVATALHYIISDHLNTKKDWNVTTLQDEAKKQRQPIEFTRIKPTLSDKITNILSKDTKLKGEEITTTINRPGDEPPITIVKPTETIIADSAGKVIEVIGHENNTGKISTPQEAQKDVDEAVEDAIKIVRPEDSPALLIPVIPPKN